MPARDTSAMNAQGGFEGKPVEELRKLYWDARAEQRAASESPMVDSDGLDDRLRQIELALLRLGVDVGEPEDRGGATL